MALSDRDQPLPGRAPRRRPPAATSTRPGMGAPRADASSERELVKRFADAWEADDIDGVVSLLTDDAWYSMPPAPFEYQGADAIGTFLREYATRRSGHRFRLVARRANTQPAFG